MTRGEAKRRAYELAALYLRDDIDAGAEMSGDPEEYLMLYAAMREIIDALLKRAKVDWEMRWGVSKGINQEPVHSEEALHCEECKELKPVKVYRCAGFTVLLCEACRCHECILEEAPEEDVHVRHDVDDPADSDDRQAAAGDSSTAASTR